MGEWAIAYSEIEDVGNANYHTFLVGDSMGGCNLHRIYTHRMTAVKYAVTECFGSVFNSQTGIAHDEARIPVDFI